MCETVLRFFFFAIARSPERVVDENATAVRMTSFFFLLLTK
jgi:hypothetical protein